VATEEENTLRILKDLAPLVTSKWCWWGFHTWTKWDNSHEVHNFKGDWIIQKKFCAHCSDFKERKKNLIK
jgi:hypothetical protein